MLLKEVYEFKIQDMIQITGLSEGKIKHAIADARKHMIRIFNNRCSLINKNGACHQCTELKGVLNPEQEAHIQINASKLLKQKDFNPEELLNKRIELVKSIDPLNAPNSLLNIFMLESSEEWVKEGKEKNVLEMRPKSLTHLSKSI